jgi:hypothetical protein
VRSKRPFSVTLLFIGVLSIAGLHLLRLLQAVRQWAYLESLPGVSPAYLAATGLVWGGFGIVLAAALWFGWAWAPRGTLAAALSYALYTWLDRLFIANVSTGVYDGFAWPFRLAATAVLLGLVFWIFSRPRARSFFRRNA